MEIIYIVLCDTLWELRSSIADLYIIRGLMVITADFGNILSATCFLGAAGWSDYFQIGKL